MEKRTKYGVIRLDRVHSVYKGHIFSVIGEEDEILENGMIGNLGDFREIKDDKIFGRTVENEIRSLEKVKDNTKPIVIVAHPEINYSQYQKVDNSLEYFFVPAGTPARAYQLSDNDQFSISKIVALDEEKGGQIGNFVEPASGERFLKETATEPTGAFIGKIVNVDKLGTSTVVGQAGVIKRPIDLVVIDVRKNSL